MASAPGPNGTCGCDPLINYPWGLLGPAGTPLLLLLYSVMIISVQLYCVDSTAVCPETHHCTGQYDLLAAITLAVLAWLSPAEIMLEPATTSMLGSPLLERGPSALASHARGMSASTARARASIRRCATHVLSELKAQRMADPGRPSIAMADEYMRFFLPKTADGKLLPLRCSDAEFSAHVGSGVGLYMHFVQMTMWMFIAASVIALPQFYANLNGHALQLEWPWTSSECAFPPDIVGLVSKIMASLAYVFYSLTLGNVGFETTHGWIHLLSEMLL